MLRVIILSSLMSACSVSQSQDLPAKKISDPSTDCGIYLKYFFREDSMTWTGACTDGLAEGHGVMTGFVDGVEISRYTGYMQRGEMHGDGVFNFSQGQQWKGNFNHGELLNLSEPYLKRLQKHVVYETDPMALYDSDHGASRLHYHILLPERDIRGAVVLLPGTWETTEHVISSTQQLCEYASDQQLAVIVLSINQRLVLNDEVLSFINGLLSDAINRYAIPRDQIYMGGFSMGGLFSLRYTQLSRQDNSKTAIAPKAVFSCDGPVDLLNLHADFSKKVASGHRGESQYALREFDQYLGGSPQTHRTEYIRHSAHSVEDVPLSNAKYLVEVPVRIYGDVDPVWWIDNRGVDMYDLNALDQTAMIVYLNQLGNDNATFINAYGKGYRIEGWRHPHSWSIIDGKEIVNWLLQLQ